MGEEIKLSKEDYNNGDVHILDFKTGKVAMFNEKEEQDFNEGLDRLLMNTGVK